MSQQSHDLCVELLRKKDHKRIVHHVMPSLGVAFQVQLEIKIYRQLTRILISRI